MIINIDTTAKDNLLNGSMALDMGNFQQAIDSILLALQDIELTHEIALKLSFAYRQCKKYKEARAYISKAYELAPQDSVICLEYAEVLKEFCEFKQAIRLYKQVIKDDCPKLNKKIKLKAFDSLLNIYQVLGDHIAQLDLIPEILDFQCDPNEQQRLLAYQKELRNHNCTYNLEIKNLEQQFDFNSFGKILYLSSINQGLLAAENLTHTPEPKTKPIIMATCMPGADSSFVLDALQQGLNLPTRRLSNAYRSNEQDLNALELLIANQTGCVSIQHNKATSHNLYYIKLFKIKVLVQVRNIFDAAYNLAKQIYLQKDSYAFCNGLHGYSFLYPNIDIKSSSLDNLMDVVVDFAVPWYINFYASWFTQHSEIDYQLITYQELGNNPELQIKNIYNHLGVEKPFNLPADQIQAAWRQHCNNDHVLNENHQTKSYGAEMLGEQRTERILQLLQHYPSVDFSALLSL